ncbi:MAG: RluA family pseudouridine synthase [Clostridia bacterium]
MTKVFLANECDKEKRFDIFALECLPSHTRSHIKNLIENGLVLLNGKTVKAGYPLKTGDKIEISEIEPKKIDLSPEDIPLSIVYEDDDLLVINKQAGLVVHPGGGSYSGTLVNALLYKVKNLSGINGEVRPGIVHRLDKDTTGLMLVAKNDFAHVSLSKQIANKTCVRKYVALCDGVIQFDEKVINTQIGRSPSNRKMMAVLPEGQGKNAITIVTVLKRYAHYTLVECLLKTGRTHQIRVHMKHVGHSVTNDELYGTRCKAIEKSGQLLHSKYISFVHPRTNETMSFESEPPKMFLDFLQKIE